MIHVEIPENIATRAMVNYFCDVCGGNGSIRYDHYRQGVGCSYCSNKKVLPGFNDIATTSSGIVPWLKFPEDAYKYTKKSHHKLDLICHDCGFEFKRIVADATRRGLRCPFCSGSISYPNRYMEAVLKNLQTKFTREAKFQWSLGKRYDFYIEDLDMIVEMHGDQHYAGFTGKSIGITAEDVQNNDIIKYDIAIKNGIGKYVVIDSRVSDAEYIKSNILSSELSVYFDFSKMDWVKVEKDANKGYWNEFISAFNEGMTIPEISKKFGRSCIFVSKILKEATAAGECNYSVRDQILRSQSIAVGMHKKPIICITTNTLFDSLNTACEYYGINAKALSRHLTGHSASSGMYNGQRLKWKYAT